MTRKRILYILLTVLVMAMLYAYWASPRQEKITGPDGVMPDQPVGREVKKGVDPKKVALDLLEHEKQEYSGFKRNIFNYYRPRPKQTKKPIVKPPPEPVKVEPPKPAPIITPRTRQELARFTFLGFLLKNEERTVFLSRQDDLFLVKEGDFFGDDRQFEVVDINSEKLTIKQTGRDGRIEIKLVEEEPLIPSYSPGEIETERAVPVVGRPANAPTPDSGVPAVQRKRQWFKQSQPGSSE